MSSNQRPDTLMQDRITQIDEIFLHRTAGPYSRVRLGNTHREHFTSEVPSIADVMRTSPMVRLAPTGDVGGGYLPPRVTPHRRPGTYAPAGAVHSIRTGHSVRRAGTCPSGAG